MNSPDGRHEFARLRYATQGANNHGMSATDSTAARLWIVLGSIACLTAVLHWVDLLHVAQRFGCSLPRLTCPGPVIPWVTLDTGSYREVAGDIARRGVLRASYLQRTPGLPLMLSFGRLVLGDEAAILWFVPLLGAAACVAVGWVTFAFTRMAGAAAFASLMFLAWPPAYEFTPVLLTDATHAYVAVTAFAATLGWFLMQRIGAGCLAAVLWMAAQSIRPTFFPLPILLPILLCRRGQSRQVTRVSLGIWLASTVVPAFIVTSNYVQHGVAIVSSIEPETLACYAIPRLKEELGLGPARHLRETARERYRAVADPRERVALQRRDAWDFLRAHPWQALASFRNEFMQQLFAPITEGTRHPHAQGLYRSWPLRVAIDVFWLCAALGLVILAPQQPRVVLFMLLAFAAVMAPATTSHWVGGRLRLPLDLLFMPAVATFFGWLASRLRPSAK